MKFDIVLLVISLVAVVLGIRQRRWAVACALFVLHLALAGAIVDYISYRITTHQNMEFTSRTAIPAKLLHG